jgi:hypothetical protein
MSSLWKLSLGWLALLGSLQALPVLQLDIAGGTYDSATQSVVAPGEQFDLYALVNSGSSKFKGTNDYYLSAAVIPQGTRLTAPFGSFSVTHGGVTTVFSASQNMVYGTPPTDVTDIDSAEAYEALTDWNLPNFSNDLKDHGIYDTSFGQLVFSFSNANRATSYNVQNSPGGLSASPTGSLYYELFHVDTSALTAGFTVHFDLFWLDANGDVAQFAPFSHDAQGIVQVPDSNPTALLVGSGFVVLLGLQLRIRRSFRKSR